MSGAELAAHAGLRPPAALTIAITGRCNLRCGHCWVEAGMPTSAGHAPADRVLRLVDGFAALGAGAIWITGGEPLTHPAWLAILSHCCARPSVHAVGLQTNGALLDDACVARLRALPAEKLHVEVSLDGASPRAHDRVRGTGSFAAAMAGTARLVAAGLGGRTAIAFTEMRHNMKDVPDLLRVVDRLGLRAVVGGTLVRDGSAARSALEPPTPAQYRALLSRFHADARLRELYERYGRFPAVEWWKGRAGARGDPCTFLEHPYVSAEGTMYPCRLCHADAFAVGEAFEKPLDVTFGEAIAKARELVRLARGRLVASPECQRCPARLPCAGGCVGRALAAGGSVAAAEDRCELRKRVQLWEPSASATTWRETTSVSAALDRAPRDAVIGMPTAALSRAEVATGPRVAHLAAPEQIASMDIHELLAEEREAIVDEAWRSVVKLTHYERDGKEATRQRTEVLFDHVAHAIRVRDLGDLLDYAERIAKQRFDAGFEMCEVQNAFYMVEDAIARRALARLPPAALAEALGLVGTAIRRGKDQFARAYISLANRKRAPSLDLSDLFKGR